MVNCSRQKDREGAGLGRIVNILVLIMLSLFITVDQAKARPAGEERPVLFLGNESLPPMNFIKNGEPAGVVVDLAKAVGKRMNRPVEIRLMDWARAQQLVLEGSADGLLQINPNQERLKVFDFSQPLLTSEFTIFTTAGRVGITSLFDLRGLKVGVEQQGLPISLLKGEPGIMVSIIPDFVQGFRMLTAGKVDALVADRWVGGYILAENSIRGVRLVEEPISLSDSAIAVKKGNASLLREINAALADIRRDGTYDRVIKAWRSKEVVFETREQLRERIVIIVLISIALILALAGVAVLLREVRKRRRVEAALRETEQKQRLFIEHAPAAIAMFDRSMRYMAASRRWLADYRLGDRDIIGLSHYDVFPEMPERWKKVHENALAGVTEKCEEEAFPRLDGKTDWLRWEVLPWHDLAGNIGGIIISTEDITERKSMEGSLRESENRFHLALRNAPVSVAAQDRNLRYVWAYNQRTARPEEIIGKLDSDIFSPDEAAHVTAIKRRVLEEDIELREQMWFDRPGGKIFLDVCWEPIHDQEGRVVGVGSATVDLTPMKAAEEVLEQSRKRFRMLAEATFEGIAFTEGGRILEVNDQFARMMGYGKDELIGTDVELLVLPEDRPRVLANILEGRDSVIEHRSVRKDGTVITVEARGKPFMYEGRPARMTAVQDVTERMLADKATREARELLSLATAAARLGIYDYDIVSDVIGWDRRTREMWGVGPEEPVTYEAFISGIHPDDRGSARAAMDHALDPAGEGKYYGEYRVLSRKDGGTRWIASAGQAFFDGGRAIRLVGTVQDITERKQALDVLQSTLRRFYTILSNLRAAILLIADDGFVEFANQALCDYFDLSESPAELKGLAAEEIKEKISPAYLHPARAFDRIRQIIAEGKPVLSEEVEMKGGRTYIRDFVPLRVDGKSYGRVWFHLDITERKRFEEGLKNARDALEQRVQERTEELRRSEALALEQKREIESYYHTAPIGLCVLDKDLRYVRINESLAEMNGIPASEHIGRSINEIVPWLGDGIGAICRQIIETGEPVTSELTGETRAEPGVPRIWVTGWYPLKGPEGRMLGISVVVEEVTRQRKLEEQLRQAQKMEAMGTLAGGIAHDFNNILAAILGFTEMAIDDVTDRPLVTRNLQNVMKSAVRARELVKQILTFSRKSGQGRAPVAVTPVVKETVQLLRASIPATIEIRVSVRVTSDTVLGSPVEIQQILMNLATNASLAMQGTGGVMEVNLTDIDFGPDSPVIGSDVAPGEYLQIMVKDTGIGMDPEIMKRVFEPFYTTREVGKGTGMGLAVVYGIVKDLQGAVTVESEPGAGSIFRVFLPKVKTARKTGEAEPESIRGGTEHILLVDDEPMLVEWGRATLERLGYRVTAVTESREALSVFLKDPSSFDLVITDQAMPKKAGDRLAAELLKTRSDIPIILCTGHSETITPEKAKESGIKEFLLKPLSKPELAGAIRKVLDEKNGQIDSLGTSGAL